MTPYLSRHFTGSSHASRNMKIAQGYFAARVLFGIGLCAFAAMSKAMSDESASGGHSFALKACGACHVVAADQEAPPILYNPAPSFDVIANKRGTTADSLRLFLKTTHTTIREPNNMPNPMLADYQTAEVIAYILSLRK